MARTPSIALRKDIPHIKHETTFWLDNAPLISAASGELLRPWKATITEFPRGRGAYVKVYGNTQNAQARSVSFNLSGYPYRPPPDWLRTLIIQADCWTPLDFEDQAP